MKQVQAKILENKKLTPHHCRMRMGSGYLAKAIKPGQFLEVRCSGGTDPLLRRPISVHRISDNWIEILFEVVGKGTELLAMKKRGETLDIIGPLGNGFTVKPIVHSPQSIVLIAGGIGVAPLVALAEELAYSVERIADRKKIHILIGAKTKTHILCVSEFKKLGCKVSIATEDGSKGFKGFITDLLKKELSAIRYPLNAMIYACGPTGMLKAVSFVAGRYKVPCQVSLEEHMACGVGVCLGCPVKVRPNNTINDKRLTNDEYKMVCKDGPVFNSKDIIW